MTIALETVDLSRQFAVGKRLFGRPRGRIHAVQPLSLQVMQGETLGIVGESGCGKSTLARMLVGLLPASSGRIAIEGKTLERLRPTVVGRQIQYVFQDPIASLNPRKTIRRILAMPLRHHLGLRGPELESRIQALLESVNLRPELLDRYPHEFSGGQAQRIGIARALAPNPRILVLDEPVSALDVSIQAQVLNLLADLKVRLGLTYLFISHDLAVVEAVSDRIAVLYFGSLVESGPAEQVFARPGHPYTRLLADSAPVIGRALGSPPQGELPDPMQPPPGCAFASRCPLASDRCRTEVPRLRAVDRDRSVACHHPIAS